MIVPFQVKGHRSVPFNTELYYSMVIFNDDVTIRWMVYLFHITWPCIIQSNDNNLHWCYIMPHNNQSAIFFPVFGRNIQADSYQAWTLNECSSFINSINQTLRQYHLPWVMQSWWGGHTDTVRCHRLVRSQHDTLGRTIRPPPRSAQSPRIHSVEKKPAQQTRRGGDY